MKPIEILLIEDNPGDAELTMEALNDYKFRNKVHLVTDGEEALHFLYKEGKHKKAVTPDLILLDINLPKINGPQILEKVKKDDDLRKIPVVVLTTSRSEEDVLRMYDLHANCYIKKPIDLNDFINVVRSIEDFWMSIVILPTTK